MALQVIGAGFGRTGTMSLKLALEQLGFGPCHHMVEVFRTDSAEVWARAAAGEAMDWEAVFAGYRAACDWPSCDYWEEMAAAFPEAKIILTLRDPEAWFRSTQATIFGEANAAMLRDEGPKQRMVRGIFARHFGGRNNDREALLAGYHAHVARVRARAPAGRLLEYEVSQGWGPLCAFLGVPVPAGDFPSVNSTEEFRSKVGRH